MRTPSLERRAVATGVATVGFVVVVASTIVYLALATSLEGTIDQALTLRASIVEDVARDRSGVSDLAEALSVLGIPAVVEGPQGTASSQPAVVRNRPGEELILSTDRTQVASRTVTVAGDRNVTLLVSRTGATETLRRLLLFEIGASIVALLAAFVLLRRGTAAALAPLDDVVAAAQRTAQGHAGQRLEADDPTSELGRLAVAYDHMLDELEAALAEARQAEERSRRFLADAAHQLRTPLASIRAAVELLLIEPDARRRDEHLGHLLRETTRGTKVLNSLLTLARLDRGRPIEVAPVDVTAIARDEVDRARSLAPHLTITTAGTEGPATCAGHDDAIREAVANLLDNARRHASEAIVVSVSTSAAHVEVRIGDDGPGIPDEARELVFERFATLDGKGGSGLGLPIARAIAHEHGGDLTYDDAGFCLTLAREHAPEPAPAPPD